MTSAERSGELPGEVGGGLNCFPIGRAANGVQQGAADGDAVGEAAHRLDMLLVDMPKPISTGRSVCRLILFTRPGRSAARSDLVPVTPVRLTQ